MKKRIKGFSLIEVLLVMALIGLLSALVIPAISNTLSNARLKTAVKKTAGIIRYVHNQAISQKRPFWLLVDKVKSRIAVLERPWNNEAESSLEKLAMLNSLAKAYYLPKGVIIEKIVMGDKEISDSESAFIFYPNGSCIGGKIQLSNIETMRTFLITVDPIVGSVRVDSNGDEIS